jgi:hypothetical protein
MLVEHMDLNEVDESINGNLEKKFTYTLKFTFID